MLKTSIETIQNFILPWNKGDRHAFNRYDNNQYYTDEKENAYGMDIKYDFKLTNQISGNIKLGTKSKVKNRRHNRDYQYAYFGYVAVQDKRDSTIKHFDWLSEKFPGTIDRHTEHLLIMTMPIQEILDGQYTIGHFLILRKAMQLHDYWSGDHFIQRNHIMKW